MSGIMHPVGPESPETYWVRRALVVGALLVLVIIILLFLFNLGGNAGQAAPSHVPATQSATPTVRDSASASPSPSSTESASATGSPTPSSTASDSASPSAKADKSDTAKKDESSDQKDTSDDQKSGDKKSGEQKSDDKKADDQTSGDKKSDDKKSDQKSEKSTKTTTESVADCKPSDLKTKLKADGHHTKIGKDVDFTVSLINKSGDTCKASVDPDHFELKIYSGSDRIWSTDDCTKLVQAKDAALKSKQDLSWKITWDGKRSEKGATCKTQPSMPQAGYYYATAQFKGAKPVQWLLVLS